MRVLPSSKTSEVYDYFRQERFVPPSNDGFHVQKDMDGQLLPPTGRQHEVESTRSLVSGHLGGHCYGMPV